jgi:hypothetical protein
VLSPGGNIASFEASLSPGQTGCLHGGTYLGKWILSRSGLSGSPITLTSYPGELAVLDANGLDDALEIDGADYLNLVGLKIVNSSGAGAAAVWYTNGASHNLFAQNEVGPTQSQGVHSSSTVSFLTVDRNRVHDICCDSTRQTHGLYLEGADLRVTNNLIWNVGNGFGIHIYPYARRVRIVNNTVDNASLGPIVFGGSGSGPEGTGVADVDVVNNIGTNSNLDYGVQCYESPSNYRIHDNLFFGVGIVSNCALGADNPIASPLYGSAYHLDSGSAGIDTGDPAWAPSSDLDGVARPQGAGVDKGAYER